MKLQRRKTIMEKRPAKRAHRVLVGPDGGVDGVFRSSQGTMAYTCKAFAAGVRSAMQLVPSDTCFIVYKDAYAALSKDSAALSRDYHDVGRDFQIVIAHDRSRQRRERTGD